MPYFPQLSAYRTPVRIGAALPHNQLLTIKYNQNISY